MSLQAFLHCYMPSVALVRPSGTVYSIVDCHEFTRSLGMRLFCFYLDLFFFPAILFISTYFAQYFAQCCSISLNKISYLTPCIHCTDYSIRVYRSYQYFSDIKQAFGRNYLLCNSLHYPIFGF